MPPATCRRIIASLALSALLCLPPSAPALDGKVLDAVSGAPVVGAIVTLGESTAISGSDGGYSLHGDGPQLYARAIGYGRAAVPLHARAGVAPPLLLPPLRPKALYLSAYGVGDAALREAALRLLASTELNALVIDFKGDSGIVPYASAVAQAAQCGARNITTVRDMPALVLQLKQAGLYLIARIVTFKDNRLASAHPAWSVRRGDGALFRDREHMAWIDPFQREAWPYFLGLAEEAAAMGFDEVQFDYVRFPDSRGLRFAQESTAASRVAAITAFLQAARSRLTRHNTFLAADVFGYTAWNEDDTEIGQDLAAIAAVVDYVSPMLYPSGFQYGIPGYPDPMRHPAQIVGLTLRRAITRTGGNPLRLRPWLQAFRDYASDHREFGAEAIRAQIDATESAGSDGWMLWNPRNVYGQAGLRRR